LKNKNKHNQINKNQETIVEQESEQNERAKKVALEKKRRKLEVKNFKIIIKKIKNKK